MTKAQKAINIILKHEGGYVNDPNDPGGETKYGICKRSYPHLIIKKLTKEVASRLYYKDYWIKHNVAAFPDNLQLTYFDMVVNMGKRNAVKTLQRALTNKGIFTKVDGGLGPQTLGNIKKSGLENSRLKSYRVKYYADLVAKKPNLERYYYGWYKRAIST
jgi:lysozyme family protein